MPKQKSPESQLHNKQPKQIPQSDVTHEQGTGSFDTGGSAIGAVLEANSSTIQAQASRLGDARFPTVQRQMMANQIATTHGNQHMARVMRSVQGKAANGHKTQGNTVETKGMEAEIGDLESGLGAVSGQPIGTGAPPIDNQGFGKYTVQAKLTVNAPNDIYEQEADQVADTVMRQRDDSDIEPVEKFSGVQAKEQVDEVPEATPEVESNISALQGGGQPLPEADRSFFESRMGQDFSQVRVHTDGLAVQTSQDLNAKAFTVGNNVAFNSGEYQPGTESGRHLLAHELTHVVQQGASGPIQRKTIQREEAAGDLPTEEEKSAALAKAEAARAVAQSAESTGISEADKAKADADTKKAEGQTPKQELAASVAVGPVNRNVEQNQQVEVQSGAQQAVTQKESAESAAVGATQTAIQQAVGLPTLAQNGAAAPTNGEGSTASGAAGGGNLESATALAKVKIEQAFTGAESAPDKAPRSPQEDTAYQTVLEATKAVGEEKKTHGPAEGEANEAQAAAESPAQELEGKAQSNQVGDMEQTPTPDFDAAGFKAQLMDKIASLAPQNAAEADEFKENDKLNGVKGEMEGQVKTEKETSQGPLEQKANETPNTAGVEPKAVTPLQSNDVGQVPGDIGTAQATPKPKGQGEVETPLQQSSQALDSQMAEADITEEQLLQSNEPDFVGAVNTKKESQTAAETAPSAYRQFEQGQVSSAEAEATAAAQEKMQAMQTDRVGVLSQVDSQQTQTKSEDEKARAKIAADINGIYEKTKTKVTERLDRLDQEVSQAFDSGAEEAKKAFEDYVDKEVEAYKEERYGGWLGWAKWIEDQFLGLPSEVNSIYSRGRDNYLAAMDKVIDKVVAIVGTGLAEAKAEVANGKKEIQTYVDQLPEDLKQVGQDAATQIQGKFDELEQNIAAKQSELIDTLANKYQENLQAIDARIEQMKEENKGLIDKAIEAVGGVISTIIELKNMLLGILSSAMDAVMMILQDPIGFVGNLINAVAQGLQQFVTNIGTHLQTGFVEWLTGTMGGAGITMPEDIFSLEGVLDLALQVLGLTWDNFRARAVGVFGATVVGALETGLELFIILKDEGLAGLWEWAQEELGGLVDEVIEGIKGMLITEVIEAGITWLVSMLGGPAGAFIKAAKMIYDIVIWFINNAQRIASLVQAITESVVAIASGNVTEAANFVEQSLARFVPTAIGFLAGLVGLGDLSQKVRKVIDKVQEPVNKAMDKVLNMIKDFVMKIAKMLGFGGEGKEGGEIGEEMTFSADGESHRLFVDVQGSQATLKVASEEMTLLDRLAKWEEMLNAPATEEKPAVPEEKKAQALPLIGQVRGLLTGAEESADYLAQKKESVKKVDEGDKLEAEQKELVQEQTSLTDVLKQLFEILGEKMPEWKGQAQIKFNQAMADDNLPGGVKSRFENAALEGLFNLGEEADGNQQWEMLKNIVNGGGYVAQGENIPVNELEAKGGMTRVMSMSLVYQFNLSATEKEKYGTFQDWLQAIANEPANFVPNQHLDMGSVISGRGGIAWWAPRAEQRGNTMAELVTELGLEPTSYEGGAIRATLSPEASNMSGFKKPTALDGIFFELWEPAPGNVWGVTSGGSLEAVAESIPLSQATQLEYLSANLPAPADISQAIGESENLLKDQNASPQSVQNQLPAIKDQYGLAKLELKEGEGITHFVEGDIQRSAKTIDEILASQKEKVKDQIKQKISDKVRDIDVDNWVAIFASKGRQLYNQFLEGQEPLPLTFGDLLNENGGIANAITRIANILQQNLNEALSQGDIPANKQQEFLSEIPTIAEQTINHLSPKQLCVIQRTDVPRYLKAAKSSEFVEINNNSPISPSLYGKIAKQYKDQVRVNFGEEVHHAMPMYLGGSHEIKNLLKVYGGASVNDSIHNELHDFVDEMQITAYLQNQDGEPIPVPLSAMDDETVQNEISSQGFNAVIGTLLNDGSITYEDTQITLNK